jgi:hypothetical protein
MKTKLTNPFALILEGFVAGAILFWPTQPVQSEAAPGDVSGFPAPVRQIAGM